MKNGILLHSFERGKPFEFIAEIEVTDDTSPPQIVDAAQRKLPKGRGIRRGLAATPALASVLNEFVGRSIEETLATLRERGFWIDRWGGLWVLKPRHGYSGAGGSADASFSLGDSRTELMRCAA